MDLQIIATWRLLFILISNINNSWLSFAHISKFSCVFMQQNFQRSAHHFLFAGFAACRWALNLDFRSFQWSKQEDFEGQWDTPLPLSTAYYTPLHNVSRMDTWPACSLLKNANQASAVLTCRRERRTSLLSAHRANGPVLRGGGEGTTGDRARGQVALKNQIEV